MRRIAWLAVALGVLTASGCWMSTDQKKDTVNITGTVRHYDLEGGFWAVRGDDNTTYDPMGGLPTELQKDGIRVRLEGKLRPEIASAHMVGPIVEVHSIKRL
jgi:hypothetical protein